MNKFTEKEKLNLNRFMEKENECEHFNGKTLQEIYNRCEAYNISIIYFAIKCNVMCNVNLYL